MLSKYVVPVVCDQLRYIVCDLRLFFFQAEDGIRDRVRSRGLGDVYKRQGYRLCQFGDRKEVKRFGESKEVNQAVDHHSKYQCKSHEPKSTTKRTYFFAFCVR